AGLTCVRLNTPGGFGEWSLAMLERCARQGGLVVVYGHPHSLTNGNAQDESLLRPFLRRVQELRREGLILPRLPRELIAAQSRLNGQQQTTDHPRRVGRVFETHRSNPAGLEDSTHPRQ